MSTRFSLEDERWMRLAIRQGQKNLGRTAPNPSVGCAIVKDRRLLGLAATAPGGRPHAEACALAQAASAAHGATAYVTLEPCCHHGHTPPCVDALMAAGIKRVVIGQQDPDPRVAGQGIVRLRDAGIDVACGCLEVQTQQLHAGFVSRMEKKRPWVTWKLATTLDGRMALASGNSHWITGPEARAAGHLLRATHDAILTGIGTVLADNPLLTCRLPGMGRHTPIRIITDSRARLEECAALVQTAQQHPVWRLHAEQVLPAKALPGVRDIPVPEQSGRLEIAALLTLLAEQGITRLLLESGPRLATSFWQAEMIDEIQAFIAPRLFGGDAQPLLHSLGLAEINASPHFERARCRTLGADLQLTLLRRKPCLPAS